MYKKTTAILLALSLGAALFTGCSSDTSEAASTTASGAADAPAQFTVLCSENYDPAYPLKDTPVFQEFERMANVDITYEEIPGGSSLDTVVQTRLASGVNLPDVMQAGPFPTATPSTLPKKACCWT